MLHSYAVLTAGATFLLLIAGGLVTSTDSGLAVPDWPLSYGMWFPPMVGGIVYEHGHRMIAGVVGLMILVLAVWLARTEPRRWVRRLGYAALAAVIVQALLGGLTVLLLLPPQVSIAHACLGQAVLCLVVCLAWGTAPGWEARMARADVPGASALRTPSLAVAGASALQVLLGAVIRHTGSGVGPHLAGAVSLLVASGWCAWTCGHVRSSLATIWAHAWRVLGLVLLQLIVGFAVFAHRGSVILRTGHVALGALVLAQAVVLAWDVARRTTWIGTALGRRLADYLELTKPRLSALVLITTGAGYWLGLHLGDSIWRLVPLAAGTALVVAGANALNQWLERDRDALMHRTMHRPLPASRMRPEAAFRFGLSLSVAGLLILVSWINALSMALAALAWIAYVLVYTPLKRRTPLCTLVGAIPGALPPVIGWAGARGTIEPEAVALFTILFCWQLPHFLALAVLYREDYARAGFPMLPLVDDDGRMTARQMVLYGVTLLPLSLVPTLLGVAGTAYFYGAMGLGVIFCVLAARAAWTRTLASARQLFHASVAYLPALLGLLALDRIPL